MTTLTEKQQVTSVSNTTRQTGIAIIGSGFGGLAMAIRLLQTGYTDFMILEKSNEVGGTWRENKYPGAACDVQSHMYSFSFAPKTDWSKRYANCHEIHDYILDTTEKFGLRPYCHFNQEVIGAYYQEHNAQWRLEIKDQSPILAQFVVLASGPLHVPQIPKINGIEKFKGKVFHSAQWDHTYDLKNKTVASIGTGGSAIQYVPEIANLVKQLYVFQRSAAWVIPRDERPYSNLSKTLFNKVPLLRKIHRARLYWSNESRVVPIFKPEIMKYGQKLVEAWIRYQVKDKEIARKLIPDYVMGCKRILISNKYYPTFNRKNVELVTDGIQEVTEDSIISSDGKVRKIDCIIYGTGFITDPRIYMKDFPCQGIDGHDLMKDWKDNAESYYGILTKGFPNLFQLVGPNTGLGHNSIIFMIEAQVEYILKVLNIMQKQGADSIEIKADVQDHFNQKVQKDLSHTVWNSGCNSWYTNAEGKNFSLWPGYTWKYWLETQSPDKNAFILRKAKTAPQLNIA
ncbi:MAG: NAD(P)/FAD-dependent oxidoreductase [Acinetobacter populi]|jgi:cyclohexanone monooxygenase|uniref:flavin-containing monooxygenase n=1 Tax=Acinetobacter populi TaxID=1582270 RepID=UPI0023544A63|nr:NAD(P)/FAD-dependent oxidoreductase [Acinetobacter populi]MCH4247426.1 NAD(P)/FAD-dependent oxidoreductase [Acinetobacter populi]